MKRNKILIILSAIVAVFSLLGCDATQQPYNLDQPSGPPPVVPAAPITAAVMVNNNAGVAIVIGAVGLGATGITGATINVNGTILTDMGGGAYQGTINGLAAGSAITVSITSSAGNASGAGVIPATGGNTSTSPLTGADASSFLTLFNF